MDRRSTQKEPLNALSLKLGINQLLQKKDINVCHIEAVDFSFNARLSAIERTYQFKLLNTPDRNLSPFERNRLWLVPKQLDYDKMQEACKLFEGEHDLATFHSRHDQSSRTVRNIYEFGFTIEKNKYFNPWIEGNLLNFTVRARSFMMHQVRKMVGAVTAVGLRKITVPQLQEIIESKDPLRAPQMAPPQGLYLVDVKYPKHVIKDSSLVDWNTFEQDRRRLSRSLPIDDEMRQQLKIWEETKRTLRQQKEKAEQLEKEEAESQNEFDEE